MAVAWNTDVDHSKFHFPTWKKFHEALLFYRKKKIINHSIGGDNKGAVTAT